MCPTRSSLSVKDKGGCDAAYSQCKRQNSILKTVYSLYSKNMMQDQEMLIDGKKAIAKKGPKGLINIMKESKMFEDRNKMFLATAMLM